MIKVHKFSMRKKGRMPPSSISNNTYQHESGYQRASRGDERLELISNEAPHIPEGIWKLINVANEGEDPKLIKWIIN